MTVALLKNIREKKFVYIIIDISLIKWYKNNNNDNNINDNNTSNDKKL